jgi:hypothetical protein
MTMRALVLTLASAGVLAVPSEAASGTEARLLSRRRREVSVGFMKGLLTNILLGVCNLNPIS